MKSSQFRTWLWDKWYEHKDEVLHTTGKQVPYEPEHYFRFYKWWLKREYQHQFSRKSA